MHLLWHTETASWRASEADANVICYRPCCRRRCPSSWLSTASAECEPQNVELCTPIMLSWTGTSKRDWKKQCHVACNRIDCRKNLRTTLTRVLKNMLHSRQNILSNWWTSHVELYAFDLWVVGLRGSQTQKSFAAYFRNFLEEYNDEGIDLYVNNYVNYRYTVMQQTAHFVFTITLSNLSLFE